VAGPVALVERASQELAKAGEEESIRFTGLAAKLGYNTWHITAGIPAGDRLRPRDLAAALRLARFKKCCEQEKELPTRSTKLVTDQQAEFMKAVTRSWA